jgi:hypothetical protein
MASVAAGFFSAMGGVHRVADQRDFLFKRADLADRNPAAVQAGPEVRGNTKLANIGQGGRAVGWLCEQIAIRDYGVDQPTRQRHTGLKRAATGQSNAKGCRTRS